MTSDPRFLPILVVKIHNRRCANTLCAYGVLPMLLVKLLYRPSLPVPLSCLKSEKSTY
jgi:hypothetical protein